MSSLSFPPAVATVEDLVDIITRAHTQAEATRYVTFAACTLFLYDFVTTIDLEVKHIWSNKWPISRFVFHLNRVWPAVVIGLAIPGLMIPSVSPMTCKNIVMAYSYISIVVSCNIAVVVVLRCWALYDRKPWVLKFLVSFLILMTGPCIFVLKRQADANQYLINTLPEILPGCIVVYTPYAWVPYTFALVFESLVFSMMLYKTYIITQKYGNTPLIRRLLIDGTLYYVVAIIAVIFCLWAATTNYLRTPVISSGLLVSVLSAMCSRMILSLYNFTGQDQVERLAPSAVGPDSIFSVRPKMAGTFGTDEENCRKLVITEGSMDHMSVEHEVTSFKVGGGLNDNYREIEMSVLHVPQRTGTNVWLSRSALQDTLTI